METKRNIIGIVGAGLIFVGAFLPWVSVLGTTSSGMDTGAGIFMLVMGALIEAFAFLGKRWSNIAGAVLALLVALWGFKQISDVGTFGDAASVGIGLYVILAGSIIALVGCALAAKRRAPDAATAPAA